MWSEASLASDREITSSGDAIGCFCHCMISSKGTRCRQHPAAFGRKVLGCEILGPKILNFGADIGRKEGMQPKRLISTVSARGVAYPVLILLVRIVSTGIGSAISSFSSEDPLAILLGADESGSNTDSASHVHCIQAQRTHPRHLSIHPSPAPLLSHSRSSCLS